MFRNMIVMFVLIATVIGCSESKIGTKPIQSEPTQQEQLATCVQEPVVLPKELVLDLPGGAKLELVLIQPGEFLMGSPKDEFDHRSDELQHRVQISLAFYIGKYEVTQEQYTALTGGLNPSYFSSNGKGKDQVGGLDTSSFPVEQVTWRDATWFCNILNNRNLNVIPVSLQKSGYKFFLPTEAQWEYACRAGTTTPFHFGNVSNGTQANCDGRVPYGTDAAGPSLQRTCKVGLYAPNPWGLYDMHGNVLEWCSDWLDDDFYANGPSIDPNGPASGEYRAFRGGGWLRTCTASPRAAIRNGGTPGFSKNSLGFRVALSFVKIQ